MARKPLWTLKDATQELRTIGHGKAAQALDDWSTRRKAQRKTNRGWDGYARGPRRGLGLKKVLWP